MSVARIAKLLSKAGASDGAPSDDLCLAIRQFVAEGDAEAGGVEWRASEKERLAPLLAQAKRVAATREKALASARIDARRPQRRRPQPPTVALPSWDSPHKTPPITTQEASTSKKGRGWTQPKSPMSRSRSVSSLLQEKLQRPSRFPRADGTPGLSKPELPELPGAKDCDAAHAPSSSDAPAADGSLPAVAGATGEAKDGVGALPSLSRSQSMADADGGPPSMLLSPFKMGAHEVHLSVSLSDEVSQEQHEADLQEALAELREEGTLAPSASAPVLLSAPAFERQPSRLDRRPSSKQKWGRSASSGSFRGAFLTRPHSQESSRTAATSFRSEPSPGGKSEPPSTRGMSNSQMQRRRYERLLEICGQALEEETVLAAQYDAQLRVAKAQWRVLRQDGGDATQRYHQNSVQYALDNESRAKLERLVLETTSKLSQLEKYNARLVKTINDLRQATNPHRMRVKEIPEEKGWLEELGAKHKQDIRKALDERDWTVKQLRHLQRHEKDKRENHAEEMKKLLKESARLDLDNDKLGRMDEAAAKMEEKRLGEQQRQGRVDKLKRELHLGYLNAQLAQMEADSKELERVMGVRLDPSSPETLRAIIDHFNEKEALVVSMQRFWAVQHDEIEGLGNETFVLRCRGIAGAARRQKQLHREEAASKSDQKARAEEHELLESRARLEDDFQRVCAQVEAVAEAAQCQLHMALQTNGCSPATIHEYLSHVHSRLDALERDGAVPASSVGGKVLDNARTNWEELARGLELPSLYDRDPTEDDDPNDDEPETVRKTPANRLKWQARREWRDAQIVNWSRTHENMKAAHPVHIPSAGGRPAANKAFLKGFWMSQMAGMECNGLTASSASEGTSHNSLLETKIRLGDKAPALVPYMDEPYTATARR